jgi:YVTN family beta-propeller protein
MNSPLRAILLATAASLAVPGWAQAPQIDPLLNRTKDPPDVYTIGGVNGAKTLFRIAFFPYDQRYIVYQAPITLLPDTPTGRTAPSATAPRLVGDSDADNFPPDLSPIPLAGLSTAPQQGDTGTGPPDPEPFQALPWDLPDPIDDFTLPASAAVLPDPFATAVSPPILAGDTIPWVDLSDGALNITNSRQPIGEVTTANATSISVGPAPAGIVISRDLTTAYVAVSGAGQVAVVDLTANRVKSTINFPGAAPYSLAITPDDQILYVAEAAEIGGIYTVNLASQTAKQLPFAVNYVTSLVLTPDGTRLWICNNLAGVTVLDVLTNTVVANLPVTSPWSVAFNRTGTRAYVSSAPLGENGTVEVYDASSYTSLASIPAGSKPHAIGVTPSGRHVFVVNAGTPGALIQISTATNAVIRTFPVGNTPSGLGMER